MKMSFAVDARRVKTDLITSENIFIKKRFPIRDTSKSSQVAQVKKYEIRRLIGAINVTFFHWFDDWSGINVPFVLLAALFLFVTDHSYRLVRHVCSIDLVYKTHQSMATYQKVNVQSIVYQIKNHRHCLHVTRPIVHPTNIYLCWIKICEIQWFKMCSTVKSNYWHCVAYCMRWVFRVVIVVLEFFYVCSFNCEFCYFFF